jgi:hypothetical protein
MLAWKRGLEGLVHGSWLAGYRLVADVVLERPMAYVDGYGVRASDW